MTIVVGLGSNIDSGGETQSLSTTVFALLTVLLLFTPSKYPPKSHPCSFQPITPGPPNHQAARNFQLYSCHQDPTTVCIGYGTAFEGIEEGETCGPNNENVIEEKKSRTAFEPAFKGIEEKGGQSWNQLLTRSRGKKRLSLSVPSYPRPHGRVLAARSRGIMSWQVENLLARGGLLGWAQSTLTISTSLGLE